MFEVGKSVSPARYMDPKTARPDALAAIMRDSTIILEARVCPVAKIHLPPTVQPAGPAPPADRGKTASRQGDERP